MSNFRNLSVIGELVTSTHTNYMDFIPIIDGTTAEVTKWEAEIPILYVILYASTLRLT